MRIGSRQFRIVLVGMMLMVSLASTPTHIAQAACSGSGCHGKDPVAENCANNIQNGASRTIAGVMTVRVRKSTSCGGVKWPQASRDTFYTGSSFSTWLANSSYQELPGTRYTGGNSVVQIYGDMWTGPVRACASIAGYNGGQAYCTDIDP